VNVTATRVFVTRLAGLVVFDPNGDPVGKVRDVVTSLRSDGRPPRVLGLVLEVLGRRRVFLAMTRVISVDPGHIVASGVVNLQKFHQRSVETLVLGELLDRRVTAKDTGVEGVVYDVGMEQQRNRDWVLSKVAIRTGLKRFGRRGQTWMLDWTDVIGLGRAGDTQGATHLLDAMDAMRPADLAGVIHELTPKRRAEVAAALDDERLADVLEELPEDVQVEIVSTLESERAADVLEEMSPDDAADLIAELPENLAEQLLALMEPDEADDVRRLLSYGESTAGGMMTTDPVILPPDATVADALARVRNPDLSPSLAAMVYVVRPPLETPTGRLLGVSHIQRLLREPPSSLVSGVIDNDIEPLRTDATLQETTRLLAAYNLVASPVVDDQGRLLGVVTVDDVLDHLLPDDWRHEHTDSTGGPDGE
jgi:CBS domain-containing protein/sporulation protein YlmC with PRC-barrel domain